MAHAFPISSPETEFLDALIESGHLLPTGVAGVYGKGEGFERIVAGLNRRIDRLSEEAGAAKLRFPPVLNRRTFEQSGFLESFPHLAGSIHAFNGGEREHGQLLAAIEQGSNTSAFEAPTEMVLVPAACYPVYAMSAGTLPKGGRVVDVESFCFRREPSSDPARMQMFRMRELVFLGSDEQALRFRDHWHERAQRLLAGFGLAPDSAPAADPFFGRAGRLLASGQKAQRLKFELSAPIATEAPTAIMSFNYHQDHFGKRFGINRVGGQAAHTACMGFGLERIVLALLSKHGTNLSDWPDPLKRELLGSFGRSSP